MVGSFYCQRCANPIELTDSLLNLNTVQVNLLRDHHMSKFKDEYHPHNNPNLEGSHDNGEKDDDDLDPTQFISSDKLEFYNKVSQNHQKNGSHKPIIYRDDLTSAENANDNVVSVSTSLTSNSFVMLSDENDDDSKSHEGLHNNYPDYEEDHGNLHMDEHHPGSISTRLRILHRIFEILSNNNEIDHPLCQDCANLLIENYKLKFDQSQREKDYYLNFLKKLRDQGQQVKQDEIEIDSKLTLAIREFEELKMQETTKLNELKQLEETKEKLEAQLNQLKQGYSELESHELKDLLNLRNDLELDLTSNVNKLDQIKSQYQVHLNHLDKLRNFNIYNSFFQISCDASNKFGTINGFRLGYKVPWSEINSGLGQVVLLLIFLLKRLDLKLVNYKLIPLGSQSQIIKISSHEESLHHNQQQLQPVSSNNHSNESDSRVKKDDRGRTKTVLNLYSSNEFSLGKLFNFNKFDISMIALLDVLSQIQDKITQLDHELELPYKISPKKDAIGGKSIRVTSNGEWTDSCKFLLTNLNWILAYTSVHTSPTTI